MQSAHGKAGKAPAYRSCWGGAGRQVCEDRKATTIYTATATCAARCLETVQLVFTLLLKMGKRV